jgi:hypothetical protein
MAYTPTVWATGNTVTAEKLNHLEEGVSNSFQTTSNEMIIHIYNNENKLATRESWSQIQSFYSNTNSPAFILQFEGQSRLIDSSTITSANGESLDCIEFVDNFTNVTTDETDEITGIIITVVYYIITEDEVIMKEAETSLPIATT